MLYVCRLHHSTFATVVLRRTRLTRCEHTQLLTSKTLFYRKHSLLAFVQRKLLIKYHATLPPCPKLNILGLHKVLIERSLTRKVSMKEQWKNGLYVWYLSKMAVTYKSEASLATNRWQPSQRRGYLETTSFHGCFVIYFCIKIYKIWSINGQVLQFHNFEWRSASTISGKWNVLGCFITYIVHLCTL